MDHLKESKYGINISGTIVNNLRFADDIDLIGEERSSLQKQFETTRIAAEETGPDYERNQDENNGWCSVKET